MADKAPITLKPYERMRVTSNTSGPSLAQQHAKAECDINSIMLKYSSSRVITHLNRYEGRFGDFQFEGDYQQAMNQVLAARQMFDDLPSQIRSRFQNDPGSFLAFAQDPANQVELIKMGLARDIRPAPPPPQPVPSEPSQPVSPSPAPK